MSTNLDRSMEVTLVCAAIVFVGTIYVATRYPPVEPNAPKPRVESIKEKNQREFCTRWRYERDHDGVREKPPAEMVDCLSYFRAHPEE